MGSEIELHMSRRIHKMDALRCPEMVRRLTEQALYAALREAINQIAENHERFSKTTESQYHPSDIEIQIAASVIPSDELYKLRKSQELVDKLNKRVQTIEKDIARCRMVLKKRRKKLRIRRM